MKMATWVLGVSLIAFVSIGANAQTDPDSATSDSSTAASAPLGKYTEAVVQVVFSDETAAEHPLAVSDLDNAAPEINKFFNQLSYGKLNLEVHFIRVHLTNIPEEPATPATWANYQACGSSCNLTVDAANAALALDSSFLNGVNGISFMVLQMYAGDVTAFGLESFPGLTQQVVQSRLAEVPKNTVNPIGPSEVSWGGWAHEFGHQLEVFGGTYTNGPWLGHPSGYASGYDLMDSCYPCHESSFGLLGAPDVTDPRTVFPGWLDSVHVATVPIPSGPTGKTFVLPPLSQNISNPVIQAVKIPIDGSRAYWVNARTRLNDDAIQERTPQGIFTEGVQIQYTDKNATFPVTVCRPFETPTCTNGNTDPPNWPYELWPVGSTFSDTNHNIKVEVVAAVTGGYEVNITRDVPPGHPDLYITPWLTPPENTYETVDIWIDSICNGYGVLKYGKRADGTVIGNGDDPCVNHENRVYATIHNIGDADAPATTASFKVSNPLGVGVTGSWTSLGTATVPALPAGQSVDVFVNWTPTPDLTPAQIMAMHFNFHSCIQVKVTPVSGELVTTNNNAQENIAYFEAVATGPPTGGLYPLPIINGAFNLTNSIAGNSQQYSIRTVSELPAGWTYNVNAGVPTLTIFSGQTVVIPVQITPPASPVGKIYQIKTDALTLLELQNHGSTHPSWYVAGGLSLSAHTVLPSTISVAASDGLAGNSVPTVRVKGTLAPAAAGPNSIVTIDLYSTAGSFFSDQVTVEPNGHFSATVSLGFFPTRVRAIWQGNMLYESAVAAGTVVAESQTTTSVISSLNPSTFDSAVTFTATINHTATATPTGSVTFKDGTTTLGSVTLSGGVAEFSTSALAVGVHSITAVYSGDFNYVGSTSPVLTQTVNGT
ncbi:MAG: Ig-like domain repeat protein [Bryobacteraceae bacterium]